MITLLLCRNKRIMYCCVRLWLAAEVPVLQRLGKYRCEGTVQSCLHCLMRPSPLTSTVHGLNVNVSVIGFHRTAFYNGCVYIRTYIHCMYLQCMYTISTYIHSPGTILHLHCMYMLKSINIA